MKDVDFEAKLFYDNKFVTSNLHLKTVTYHILIHNTKYDSNLKPNASVK